MSNSIRIRITLQNEATTKAMQLLPPYLRGLFVEAAISNFLGLPEGMELHHNLMRQVQHLSSNNNRDNTHKSHSSDPLRQFLGGYADGNA